MSQERENVEMKSILNANIVLVMIWALERRAAEG